MRTAVVRDNSRVYMNILEKKLKGFTLSYDSKNYSILIEDFKFEICKYSYFAHAKIPHNEYLIIQI